MSDSYKRQGDIEQVVEEGEVGMRRDRFWRNNEACWDKHGYQRDTPAMRFHTIGRVTL